MCSILPGLGLILFLLFAQGRSQSLGDEASNLYLQSVSGCPGSLPRDAYLRVYGNVCYQFKLNKVVNYPTAKAYCQRNGGMLALVKSKQVNDYLTHTLVNEFHYHNDVWIGLSDTKIENHFYWEDGVPLAETGFSNWAARQGPLAGATRNSDCVAMDPDNGKWSDYNCASHGIFAAVFYHSMAYICQYHTTITTTTAPAKPSTIPTQVVEIKVTPSTEQPQTGPTSVEPSSPKYCPNIECEFDCGPDGYKLDTFGCPTCLCSGDK